MATEREIERIVVRLIGDQTSYQKMLKTAPEEARRATEKIKTELSQIEKAQQRGEQVTRSVMTVTERYQDEVQELSNLKKQGAISQETYNRALKRSEAVLKQAGQGVYTLGERFRMASVGMLAFGAAFTWKVTGPIKRFLGASKNAGMSMRQLMMGLEAVSGSAEGAAKEFERIRETRRGSISPTSSILTGDPSLNVVPLTIALR